MPYSSNTDLPAAVKDKYSDHCQDVFRSAFNSALDQYDGDEDKAFRVAYSAANDCQAARSLGGLPMPDTTPAVRFLEEDGEWFIEGLVIPFIGPLPGQRDLYGTVFDMQTDFCRSWFPSDDRPLTYDHGFDATIGPSVIGRQVRSTDSEKGIWMRAQIDKSHEYAAQIRQLAEEGHLALSSGALDRLVKVDPKTRHIDRWPWVESALTPMPGNPEAILTPAYSIRSADAILHITTSGAEVPVPMAALDVQEALSLTTPEPAVRQSSSADDAAWASELRGCLTQLMADETDQPEQATLLRRAIGLIDRFIAAETDEIGTDADEPVSIVPATAYMSLTPQALHDAAIASGARCAGEATRSEPVLHLLQPETVTEADLGELHVRLVDAAQRAVRERLGLTERS